MAKVLTYYNINMIIVRIVRDIIELLLKTIKVFYYREKWRLHNKNNYTCIANDINDNIFPIDKVHVGRFTYGKLLVHSYSLQDSNLNIGSFCSIANGVNFILGGEHNYKRILSYPINVYFLNKTDSITKGDINIEDDVWIGANSIILSGVKLSRGTIVGAGSVVTKSTEPYSIVGGNPARLIKYRFASEFINELCKIKVNKIDETFIINNIEMFTNEINQSIIENLSIKQKK